MTTLRHPTWRAFLARFYVAGFVAAAVALPGAALAKNPKVEKLEVFLKDSSEKVRIKTALGLGKLGDKDAVPALAAVLAKDPVPAVRAAAASALGAIADISAKPALTAALRDSAPEVRNEAGKAVKMLKVPGPPKSLKKSYFVEVGDVLNKAKAKDTVVSHFKTHLTGRLRGLASDFFWDRAAHSDGLTFGGAIKSLKKVVADGITQVEVKITVVVTTTPGKAIVTVAEAEAAVGLEGTITPAEEEGLGKEALEAALDEAFKGCLTGIKAKE